LILLGFAFSFKSRRRLQLFAPGDDHGCFGNPYAQ
jgi:hypothetical protein